MSREPSYPKDAAIGTGSTPDGSEPDKAAPQGEKKTKALMTGVAVGIGSAAIVAALLYANRSKRN